MTARVRTVIYNDEVAFKEREWLQHAMSHSSAITTP
jgi:hypothetical protein